MAITDFGSSKNQPAPNGQSPEPPEETEKRRPGRPPMSESERKAASKDKELSTESIIELKKEIETQIAAAKSDFEALGLLADIQLSVLTLETMLIKRRKVKTPGSSGDGSTGPGSGKV
jgi:hypothetical protein